MSERSDSTPYCAGLPLASERPLSEPETAELNRLLTRSRRRTILCLSALPIGWAAVTAAVSLAPSFTYSNVVIPVAIIAMIAATPILLLLARDGFRLAGAARRGLTAGRVQRFSGVLNLATLFDSTAMALLSRRLLRDDPDGEQDVEVLVGANAVWTANGERPRRWLFAQIASVTKSPEFAATAAEWMEPMTDPDGTTTWWNRRSLSGAEQGELAAHMARARRAVVVYVLINAYFLVQAVLHAGRKEWALLAVYVAVCFWFGQRLRGMTSNLLRLRRDAALGAVAIVRTEDNEPTGEDPAETGPLLSAPTEFLPFSRLIWSHGGEAAPWRRSRRR